MVQKIKEWEKDFPLATQYLVNTCFEKSSSDTLKVLDKEKAKVLMPLYKIRDLAKSYEKRYDVKIRISEDEFEDNPYADGLHTYDKKNGKVYSKIFLHPLLRYYPEKYVRGVIEHEIGHAMVEREWNDKI